MIKLIPPLSSFDPKPDITVFVLRSSETEISGQVLINNQYSEFTSAKSPTLLTKIGESLRTKFCSILRHTIAASSETHASVESKMGELRDIGKLLCSDFFGTEHIPNDIERILTSSRVVTILFVSPRLSLPWEFLYWNDAPATKFEQFWGAKAVIARAIKPRSRHGNKISYKDLPSVGLLPYNDLPCVKKYEVPHFKLLQSSNKISLNQWTARHGDWDINREHFKDFWNKMPLNLAHFACHAKVGGDVLDASFVIDHRLTIPLHRLQVDYKNSEPINNEPLVIFNACNTGDTDPISNLSFVSTFEQLGARGVIATECAVPDDSAHLFTGIFYGYFLPDGNDEPYGRSKNLGECLYQTRKKLWTDHHNPVGLLYSLYAHPGFYLASQSENS